MQSITFISTVHEEIGRCNSEELLSIIEKIDPSVVFLEALDDTYSDYQQFLFSSWGMYHKKLEIRALQMFFRNKTFTYVPVLDFPLCGAFYKKSNIICQNSEFQKLLNDFQSLASELGFDFLNSTESIRLYDEMTIFGNSLLRDCDLRIVVEEDIEAYESSMIRNIGSYCKANQFNTAVFMCGVAHRKSILEKISNFNSELDVDVDWLLL